MTRDMMTLVITIATGTRMRADGEVKFGLVFDEGEGVAETAMKLLKKQLGELEKEYKKTTTVQDGERGG